MSDGTEGTFGYEWAIYREIIPLHKKQFLGWISPLELSFFKGKSFMDAGCGIGRNSLWPLEAGAASGYAFDFDERTVAVARENLKDHPNCRVAYQSIYDLESEDEFDVAYCIGVVHHLRDPRKAVERLARAVKPGGTLILWVYAHEGNEAYLLWFNPLRKLVTSRIPLRMTLYISRVLTAFLKLYLLLPHKNEYLKRLKERTYRHTEAMVFDQLIPEIAHYWRKEEVLGLVDGLQLDVASLTHTDGISWTLVAQKRPGR
jgi:SAM-dependent methyltransferase